MFVLIVWYIVIGGGRSAGVGGVCLIGCSIGKVGSLSGLISLTFCGGAVAGSVSARKFGVGKVCKVGNSKGSKVVSSVRVLGGVLASSGCLGGPVDRGALSSLIGGGLSRLFVRIRCMMEAGRGL